MSKKIEGVSLFSATPIAADGSIDHDRWKTHLDEVLPSGVHNVTLFGSTGANGFFTEAEKTSALSVIARHIGGRVPIMFGIGAMTTAESVRLAKYAESHGADAVLVVPLNYWKPTEREIIQHYETVAAASNLPMLLYNNPPLAGIDLTPALVSKLAAIQTLVGMKDSSGDLSRVFNIPKMTSNKVTVGIGQDTLILEAAMGSAPSWFTGLANFCPAECVAFWNAAKKGDAAGAYVLAKKLHSLAEIGARYGIIRVAHSALEILGKPLGGPRPPLLTIDKPAAAELRAALVEFGLL